MEKTAYIKQLKKIIKKYHPDLCNDENMEKTYSEITVKLNAVLNKLKENEDGYYTTAENNGNNNVSENNNSMIPIKEQDYLYYKLGIKYYKNIHPDRFYKRNVNKMYETKNYEEQLAALNKIYISFTLSEYYFNKVIFEYNHSLWANDAKEKLTLLKKLYARYENMDIENYNQIINTLNYIKEMGLKPLF